MNKRQPSEDRKAEILSVTLDLAFKVGPDHVTTGMIASRLGLTQPAVYKHFPKKEEIWCGVSEILCAQIAENAISPAPKGQDPIGRIRQMVLTHLKLVTEFPALPEIMVTRDPTGALTEARRQIQAAMGKIRTAMADEFRKASEQGRIRGRLRSEDGVMLIFGIIQGLMLRLIVTRDALSLVQDGERLLDLQISLLVGDGEFE